MLLDFGYLGEFEGWAGNLNWPGGLSSKGYGVGLWLGTKPILPKQSSSKPDVIALFKLATVSLQHAKAMLKSNATHGCINPVFTVTTANLSTLGCIDAPEAWLFVSFNHCPMVVCLIQPLRHAAPCHRLNEPFNQFRSHSLPCLCNDTWTSILNRTSALRFCYSIAMSVLFPFMARSKNNCQ